MKSRIVSLLIAAGIFVVFSAAGTYAGTDFPDEITMDYNKYDPGRRYEPPKRNFVEFPHAMHANDLELSCDQCHHVELKMGDFAKPCGECHIEVKRTKKNRNSLLLLENAMHGSCVTCHKKVNMENGDPKGFAETAPPTSCSECHTRTDVQ